MADRCHGDCCKDIKLPLSPRHLRAAADSEAAGGGIYIHNDTPHHQLADAGKLAAMLVFVGRMEDGRYLYRCTHLQPSGDCDDYQNRPYMCSAFPYGKPCPYEGCTFDAARHGLEGAPNP